MWSYEDAVKISYHLDTPKWYFLHNASLWTETKKKFLGRMAIRNEPKFCREGL
jgi:hypothetical protein